MARIHNFNAGPAVLPLPVLEKARAEFLDFAGNGMSIMEMSHRSKGFASILESADANIRRLMGISDEYTVLFLQGGASMQFAMIPLNLRGEGQTADYINTGSWATKAIKEAKISGPVNVIWDGKDENFIRMPRMDELAFTPGAAYTHICSNETIGGIRFPEFPKSASPLIADMSSEIMSRAIDVNQFGMIYAGAQKNIGPSGLALVIIRNDLLARSPESINVFLRYTTHAKEPSVYNTPNTWGIYIVKLVTEWVESLGGIAALEKINEGKANAIYEVLDSSDFWKPCAAKESRSTMNITWRLGDEELEKLFVSEAKAQGMEGLKGHRSVGGIRASIYNACPRESIDTLVAFMKDFEKQHG
ncbi:MAG TPA: 3-phosphoserine/phosphohydroxythreonine transaminase [Armatimonadota bacterium]|nr:3-phosphoserine/phosphohydroxythreonine transaminase [Armatimonadota bacterium]